MRKDLARLETEKRNLRTTDIDIVDTAKVLEMINEEDQTVAFVVQKQLPAITALTDAYIRTLENGGRVFYIGAGTSGRLGFIDAAELIPTYNIQDGLVEDGVETGAEHAFEVIGRCDAADSGFLVQLMDDVVGHDSFDLVQVRIPLYRQAEDVLDKPVERTLEQQFQGRRTDMVGKFQPLGVHGTGEDNRVICLSCDASCRLFLRRLFVGTFFQRFHAVTFLYYEWMLFLLFAPETVAEQS